MSLILPAIKNCYKNIKTFLKVPKKMKENYFKKMKKVYPNYGRQTTCTEINWNSHLELSKKIFLCRTGTQY